MERREMGLGICLVGDEYLPAIVGKFYLIMNDGYPITSC